MGLTMSKNNLGMVAAAAAHAGMNGADQDAFVAQVVEELDRVGDPLHRAKHGYSDHSAGHVASAISTVLGRGK
jgi:hypothetical protein